MVPSRCLWESQRHLACQGALDGSPSSPGTGQGCGGQGLLPGLRSLCPGMALSLIGKPLIFRLKEGAVFAHSMPLRLFFSWCYSKFLLGSTKVDVLKTQQEAPFCVIHCHRNFFFLNTSKTGHHDNLGKVDSVRVWHLQVVHFDDVLDLEESGVILFFFILRQLKWQNV